MGRNAFVKANNNNSILLMDKENNSNKQSLQRQQQQQFVTLNINPNILYSVCNCVVFPQPTHYFLIN